MLLSAEVAGPADFVFDGDVMIMRDYQWDCDQRRGELHGCVDHWGPNKQHSDPFTACDVRLRSGIYKGIMVQLNRRVFQMLSASTVEHRVTARELA